MTNYRTFSFIVTGVVAPMAIACHFSVQALDKATAQLQALDKATAQQCASHDWPKSAHQIHMDWCAANGYSTN